MMNYLFALTFLVSSAMAISISLSISGKVEVQEGCSKKAMVWLSLDNENYKERLLLMHTEVPKGGTFKFFVKPGEYQVRGSDKAGCEFLQKVSVKKSSEEIIVKMVKK